MSYSFLKYILNAVPLFISLVTSMLPPCDSTSELTMCNPTPLPATWVCICLNSLNLLSLERFKSIPRPLSFITRNKPLSLSSVFILVSSFLLGCLYLIELVSSFFKGSEGETMDSQFCSRRWLISAKVGICEINCTYLTNIAGYIHLIVGNLFLFTYVLATFHF